MEVEVDLSYATENDPVFRRLMIRTLEQLSGKNRIVNIYRGIDESHAGKASFWNAALSGLRIDVRFNAARLDLIPQSGPLVIVANHPFGVLDGIVACQLASSLRENWKILIHKDLARIPHLEPFFLPVDFRETRDALKTNIDTKRQAQNTLHSGGAVVIFPAGGIATAPFPFLLRRARELEWKPFVAKLVRAGNPTVIPIFFHGKNSTLFHAVSGISQTLRLSMVIHELRNKIGGSVQLNIGDPIPPEMLAAQGNHHRVLSYLKDRLEEAGRMKR